MIRKIGLDEGAFLWYLWGVIANQNVIWMPKKTAASSRRRQSLALQKEVRPCTVCLGTGREMSDVLPCLCPACQGRGRIEVEVVFSPVGTFDFTI